MRASVLTVIAAVSLAVAPLPAAAAPPAQAATFCPADSEPTFGGGFGALKALVGDPMGEPVTCPFGDPSGTGDLYQRTTTGVAFWRSSGNIYTFTNGVDHWARTPSSGLYWTGMEVDPPPNAQRIDLPGTVAQAPVTQPSPPAAPARPPAAPAPAQPAAPAPAASQPAAPAASPSVSAPVAAAPPAVAAVPRAGDGSARGLLASIEANTRDGADAADAVQTYTPLALSIPRLALLTATVVPIGLEDDGSMAAPDNPDTVGWYQYGPGVGGPGNAVLVGHVDWGGRLRVFGYLRDLRPGDLLVVSDVAGVTHAYTVQWRRYFEAETAPLDVLVGQGDDELLTLIACGGDFDDAAHAYVDRLVVRAAPVDPAALSPADRETFLRISGLDDELAATPPQ